MDTASDSRVLPEDSQLSNGNSQDSDVVTKKSDEDSTANKFEMETNSRAVESQDSADTKKSEEEGLQSNVINEEDVDSETLKKMKGDR